jgi:hypothetical protein
MCDSSFVIHHHWNPGVHQPMSLRAWCGTGRFHGVHALNMPAITLAWDGWVVGHSSFIHQNAHRGNEDQCSWCWTAMQGGCMRVHVCFNHLSFMGRWMGDVSLCSKERSLLGICGWLIGRGNTAREGRRAVLRRWVPETSRPTCCPMISLNLLSS